MAIKGESELEINRKYYRDTNKKKVNWHMIHQLTFFHTVLILNFKARRHNGCDGFFYRRGVIDPIIRHFC